MKRNFDAPILNLDGVPFADVKTLKDAALLTFQQGVEGDDKLSGQQRVDLFLIAHKIAKGGIVDLTAEEVATLKVRIGKLPSIVLVGRAWPLLDADHCEPEGDNQVVLGDANIGAIHAQVTTITALSDAPVIQGGGGPAEPR
jgi:hypothetical protein